MMLDIARDYEQLAKEPRSDWREQNKPAHRSLGRQPRSPWLVSRRIDNGRWWRVLSRDWNR